MTTGACRSTDIADRPRRTSQAVLDCLRVGLADDGPAHAARSRQALAELRRRRRTRSRSPAAPPRCTSPAWRRARARRRGDRAGVHVRRQRQRAALRAAPTPVLCDVASPARPQPRPGRRRAPHHAAHAGRDRGALLRLPGRRARRCASSATSTGSSLIEDCAQAIGARSTTAARQAGTVGELGCLQLLLQEAARASARAGWSLTADERARRARAAAALARDDVAAPGTATAATTAPTTSSTSASTSASTSRAPRSA